MRCAVPGRRLLLGMGSLASLVLLAAVPMAPVLAEPDAPRTPQARRVLNDIHTDLLDPVFENGELRVRTRIGNAPAFEFSDPEGVVVQLKDTPESKLSVPDLPEFAFLGAAGSPVWVAPETQVEGLVWPGWSTENLPRDLFEFNAPTVEITLTEVTGPGRVEIFNEGVVPRRLFSSEDAQFRTVNELVGTHRHVNWVFGALGAYALTFEIAATDTGGTRHVADPVTLNWYVGGTTAEDVPPELVTPTPTTSPTVTPTGNPTVTPTSTPTSSPTGGPTSDPTPTNTSTGSQPPGGGGFGGGSGGGSNGSGGGGSGGGSGGGDSPDSKCVTPSPGSGSGPGGSGGSGAGGISSERVVLDNGHVDYAARMVGGSLQSSIKDGTQAGRTTWREPSAVVLHLKPEAATQVPAGFGFLGSAGMRIWQIPQTQRAGILWLGWNTEELSGSQVRGDVTWTLNKVEGPGALAVYEFNTFGQPRVIFNSADGVPDNSGIRLGTHAHGNWAFTREGIYKVTFTHTATSTSGTRSTDTEVVTFAVGNVDPRSAQASGTSGSTPQGFTVRPMAALAGVRPMAALAANGCGLPFTGASVMVPAAVGAGLLTVGGATVGLTLIRRRRGVTG